MSSYLPTHCQIQWPFQRKKVDINRLSRDTAPVTFNTLGAKSEDEQLIVFIGNIPSIIYYRDLHFLQNVYLFSREK